MAAGQPAPAGSRDHERLPGVLAGLHAVAFVMPMLRQATNLAAVHNRPYDRRNTSRIYLNEVEIDLSQPGKLMDDVFIEAFNARLRAE